MILFNYMSLSSRDEQLAVLIYIVYGHCEDMLFVKKFLHRL